MKYLCRSLGILFCWVPSVLLDGLGLFFDQETIVEVMGNMFIWCVWVIIGVIAIFIPTTRTPMLVFFTVALIVLPKKYPVVVSNAAYYEPLEAGEEWVDTKARKVQSTLYKIKKVLGF